MDKKIFLMSVPSVSPLDASLTSYSLALGYLGAYAERLGWKVIAKDYYNYSWDYCENQIKKIMKIENPSIVGINCITMNRWSAYRTIKLLRKIKPEVKILLGGVHPTIFPHHFLINNNADIIVMHEGEETFEELLKIFEKGKSYEKVKGIAYKKNGKLVVNPPRPQIKDLNQMPIMKHEYFLNNDSKKAFFFSSRGCPNNCSFCSSSVHWGQCYRARTPKNVVDEIEYVLKKYPNVDEIRFMDDTFTLDNSRVIEICKEMLKRKIKVKWRCSGRVFPISAEMIKWMEKSGCIMISFGVETGSQRLLNDIGKNQTVDQIYNALKLVYQNSNITPEMFIILGLPGENEQSVNETINLIKRVIQVAGKPLNLTAARVLEIYPGTRIYDLAKKKNLISDDYWLKTADTPLYLEKNIEWLKKQRNKLLFANWTYAGIIPVIKLFFEKKMWKPKKIYNVIRPYLMGQN